MLSQPASTSQQAGRGQESKSNNQKRKLDSSGDSKQIIKHKRVE